MLQKIKKLSILSLLAVLLLLTLNPTTFAAPVTAGNGNLTIDSMGNTKQSFENRKINVYNLFFITSINDENIVYEVNPNYQAALISATGIEAAGQTDAEINEALVNWLESKMPSNSQEIKAFAKKLKDEIGTAEPTADVTGTDGATKVEFLDLDWGYYLILDADVAETSSGMAASYPMLHSFYLDNETIYVKSDLPTIDKTVNGEKGTAAQIGDTVSYTITGKIPNTTGYSTYTYKITDTFSEGLSFNNDLEILVGNEDVTAAALITTPDAPYTFTAAIPMVDGAGAPIYTAGDDITLNYTAVVNENAVMGESGNSNDAKLFYSNDPGDESLTDFYEIPELPKVYSFGLNVNKIDQDGTPLDGAVFILSGNASWANNTGKNGSFTFYGLKSLETYTLTETTNPTGYKPLAAPITFNLEAVYDATGTLVLLEAKNVSGGYSIDVTPEDKGMLEMTVVNFSGSKLPNTGGSGTIVYLLVGAALIGGAVILLIVSRNRKGKV